ncbi:hypothetical protein [Thermodesulfovibrio hydrogeniphilus]
MIEHQLHCFHHTQFYFNFCEGNSLKICFEKFYEIGIAGFEIERVKIKIMSKLNEEQKKVLRILGVEEKVFRTYESARELCRLI